MPKADIKLPALEALFHPFESAQLSWPMDGTVLFDGARDGVALRRQRLAGMQFRQPFKPEHDALLQLGLRPADDDAHGFDLALLLPPRQRDYARACYVRALRALSPQGLLVAAQANSDGAKSCQSDLQQLFGEVAVLSKHRCRVIWAQPGAENHELAAQWLAVDRPSIIAGSELLTRPGVFSFDRIDPASRLLAEQLPARLHGAAADLGAGNGYLSWELLRRCPGIASVDLYEADSRALALATANLREQALQRNLQFHWHDVASGLGGRYDCIVSNPPFHGLDGGERVDLGRAFLRSAAAALNPGGQLYFVANRHLPYEAELGDRFAQIETLVHSGGFKVVRCQKGR